MKHNPRTIHILQTHWKTPRKGILIIMYNVFLNFQNLITLMSLFTILHGWLHEYSHMLYYRLSKEPYRRISILSDHESETILRIKGGDD